jgi:hypothetical protein
MSELFSAFFKLTIERDHLVRWLEDRPFPARRWSDWRGIGGAWYSSGGPRDISEWSDTEVADSVGGADRRLAAFASNREALEALVIGGGNVAFLTQVYYDSESREFVAGTFDYSENLVDFIVFLAVARSATAYFGPQAHGVAVIHDFIVRAEEVCALDLGPGDRSTFLGPERLAAAVAAFQPIFDRLQKVQLGRNELDALR